ncbi:DNA replication licensing factor mcm8 [Basidiobolus ranarum]|uniref:DNA replication licensing factor mcm8 n=1 Tax=Basidiobolus ranarum TaxID=34480 RepID=A0ABR2VMV1_9FUNG
MPPANSIGVTNFTGRYQSLRENVTATTSNKGKGREVNRSSRTSLGVTIEKESRGNAMSAIPKPQQAPKIPRSKKRARTSTSDIDCPIRDWYLYFPNEDYNDNHAYMPMIKAFVTYVHQNIEVYQTELATKNSVTIYYPDIIQNCPFEELQEIFKVEPNIVLGCLGIAISEAIIERSKQTIHDGLIKDLEDYASRTKITVRISQFEPLSHLKDLKANLIGNYTSL